MENMNNSSQNIKQKIFWSGKGGDIWVERQTELDITLEPLGNALILLKSFQIVMSQV